MSLNGVQQYVKGLLDGLVLPLDLGTLGAYITPPDPGDGTQAAVYVWGSEQDEYRKTMPRAPHGNPLGGGFKHVDHALDLWVIWFGSAEDLRADSMFPLVLDAINKVLRNAQMPVLNLTDPDTGDPYTIQSIGERIRTRYSPVHATEDQRWLEYNGLITVDITESIRA